MSKLKEKIAIITGGAGEIEKRMALSYVKEGAKVAIVDLNKETGNETIKALQKLSPNSIYI